MYHIYNKMQGKRKSLREIWNKWFKKEENREKREWNDPKDKQISIVQDGEWKLLYVNIFEYIILILSIFHFF